jgi:phosphotransferase system  glucose/maltose/N-acetylglucosamine-specific IIC component
MTSTQPKVVEKKSGNDLPSISDVSCAVKKGDLAQAVDTLFDRLERIMPIYVGKADARAQSSRICGIIVLVVLPIVLFLRWRAQRTASIADTLLWIILALVTLIGVGLLHGHLVDRFYRLQEFSTNINHYNMSRVWIPRYKESVTLKAPPPPF